MQLTPSQLVRVSSVLHDAEVRDLQSALLCDGVMLPLALQLLTMLVYNTCC